MSKQDKEMEAATKSISYDSDTGVIRVGGEKIGSWNDEAHIDYPEDLTWSRTIGGLCDDLFQAGWKAASERNDAVIAEMERALRSFLEHGRDDFTEDNADRALRTLAKYRDAK